METEGNDAGTEYFLACFQGDSPDEAIFARIFFNEARDHIATRAMGILTELHERFT